MLNSKANPTKNIFSSLVYRLDIFVSWICIFLGTFILLASIYFNLKQHDIGIVLILGGFTYLLTKSKAFSLASTVNFQNIKSLKLVSNILFIASLAASIMILRENLYYRPLSYFICVAFAAASLMLDILLAERSSWYSNIILSKIVLISLIIKFGIFYEFPTLLGADTWIHSDFASSIALSGHIPSIQDYDLTPYNQFPLFHVLLSMTNILADISLKDAIFFSITVPATIGIVFIFLITKSLSGVKTALLAALIAGFSDIMLVATSTNINPGSLVMLMLLMVLFLIFYRPVSLASKLLMLISLLLMVLVHQLTVFATLVALVGLYLGMKISPYLSKDKTELNISIITVSFLSISMVAYWMYPILSEGESNFFVRMINRFISNISRDSAFDFGSGSYNSSASFYDFLSNIMFHPGFLILMFFVVIGLAFWCNTKIISKTRVSLIVALAILYFVVYGSALFEGGMTILPHRWLVIVYPILAIISAQGIIMCLNSFTSNVLKFAVGCLITGLLVFFMLTTPFVNGDSPIFEHDRSVRTAYTQSEVQSVHTLVSKYDGNVYTDRNYTKVFEFLIPSSNLIINDQIPTLDQVNSLEGILVLRHVLVTEPTIVSKSGTFSKAQTTILGNPYFYSIQRQNSIAQIYSSSYVSWYLLDN